MTQAAQSSTLALHLQLDLWAGETHANDTPNPTPEENPSVMFELHHGLVGRAGLVTTCLKMQHGNEFASYVFNDLTRGSTRCGEFRDVMDQSDEVGLLGCCLMVMTVTGSQLGHNDPDKEETHGSLDVLPVRDGKLLVGPGEEEIEPQRGRDRGHEPRNVTQCCDHHNHGHEDQGGCDVGDARTERDENVGHAEREYDCGYERYLVSLKPDLAHGTSLQTVLPVFHDCHTTGLLASNRFDNPRRPGAGNSNHQDGAGECELGSCAPYSVW